LLLFLLLLLLGGWSGARQLQGRDGGVAARATRLLILIRGLPPQAAMASMASLASRHGGHRVDKPGRRPRCAPAGNDHSGGGLGRAAAAARCQLLSGDELVYLPLQLLLLAGGVGGLLRQILAIQLLVLAAKIDK
jgi:hypothetical protein